MMKNGYRMRGLAAVMLAGGLLAGGLAGCADRTPEPAPAENIADEVEQAPAPPEPESVAPAPIVTGNSAVATDDAIAAPEETPIAADDQMRDDADATGMTTRVTRDEAEEDVRQ